MVRQNNSLRKERTSVPNFSPMPGIASALSGNLTCGSFLLTESGEPVLVAIIINLVVVRN